MSRPVLLVVADCRSAYDDRAVEAARAGLAAGWDARLLMLTTGTRVARATRSDGLTLTRVGVDGRVLDPRAVQVRALDDEISVLRARRIALDSRGESRRSPRRLAVVAATRKALRQRRDLAEASQGPGDPVALAAAELRRVGELAKASAQGATVVVAAGPLALAVAAAATGPVVYDPRPASTDVEPALRAATSVVLEGLGARRAGVLSPATDADLTGLLELLAARPEAPSGAHRDAPGAEPADDAAAAPVVLGVAPANFAGQGWAWGRAAEAHLSDVRAQVVAASSPLDFPVDVQMTSEDAASLRGQLEQAERVLGSWTHVLAESVRPVLGQLNGSVISGDLAALSHAGVKTALVCHGTDIRRPAWHHQTYPFSPFDAQWDQLTALADRTARNGAIVRALTVPVFVSTPDLLDDVPFAEWLPVVVSAADLEPAPEVLVRDVPVVLHLPSSPRFKGTDVIDDVGQRLAAEGLIEYRSLREVPAREVPALIREADVVVDHVLIGNYGVLACQAMAAGRVTVGHVHERVRRRVPAALPVVEADPTSLEAVLRDVLADRDSARSTAQRGPAFVRELHDGRVSARVLASFVGR